MIILCLILLSLSTINGVPTLRPSVLLQQELKGEILSASVGLNGLTSVTYEMPVQNSSIISAFDRRGNLLWSNTLSNTTTNGQYDTKTEVGVDNSVFIASRFYTSTDLGNGFRYATNAIDGDFFVVKYNTQGTALWDITCQSAVLNYLRLDSSEGLLYLVGEGPFILKDITYSDGIFVVALNELTGEVVRATNIRSEDPTGGPRPTYLNGFDVLSGSFIVAGFPISIVSFDGCPDAGPNVPFLAYYVNGTCQYTQPVTFDEVLLESIHFGPNDTIYLQGSVNVHNLTVIQYNLQGYQKIRTLTYNVGRYPFKRSYAGIMKVNMETGDIILGGITFGSSYEYGRTEKLPLLLSMDPNGDIVKHSTVGTEITVVGLSADGSLIIGGSLNASLSSSVLDIPLSSQYGSFLLRADVDPKILVEVTPVEANVSFPPSEGAKVDFVDSNGEELIGSVDVANTSFNTLNGSVAVVSVKPVLIEDVTNAKLPGGSIPTNLDHILSAVVQLEVSSNVVQPFASPVKVSLNVTLPFNFTKENYELFCLAFINSTTGEWECVSDLQTDDNVTFYGYTTHFTPFGVLLTGRDETNKETEDGGDEKIVGGPTNSGEGVPIKVVAPIVAVAIFVVVVVIVVGFILHNRRKRALVAKLIVTSASHRTAV